MFYLRWTWRWWGIKKKKTNGWKSCYWFHCWWRWRRTSMNSYTFFLHIWFIIFFSRGRRKCFHGWNFNNNLHIPNTHPQYYSITVIYKSHTLFVLDTLYTHLPLNLMKAFWLFWQFGTWKTLLRRGSRLLRSL